MENHLAEPRKGDLRFFQRPRVCLLVAILSNLAGLFFAVFIPLQVAGMLRIISPFKPVSVAVKPVIIPSLDFALLISRAMGYYFLFFSLGFVITIPLARHEVKIIKWHWRKHHSFTGRLPSLMRWQDLRVPRVLKQDVFWLLYFLVVLIGGVFLLHKLLLISKILAFRWAVVWAYIYGIVSCLLISNFLWARKLPD